jgi:hypothetical protein
MCPQVSIDIPNAFHEVRLNIETASEAMDNRKTAGPGVPDTTRSADTPAGTNTDEVDRSPELHRQISQPTSNIHCNRHINYPQSSLPFRLPAFTRGA